MSLNKRNRALIAEGQRLLAEANKSNIPKEALSAAKEMVAQSSKDALDLFIAMKGMGTDEEAVKKIIQKRKDDLSALYDEFSFLLKDIDSQTKSVWTAVKEQGPAVLGSSGVLALSLLFPDSNKVEPDKSAIDALGYEGALEWHKNNEQKKLQKKIEHEKEAKARWEKEMANFKLPGVPIKNESKFRSKTLYYKGSLHDALYEDSWGQSIADGLSAAAKGALEIGGGVSLAASIAKAGVHVIKAFSDKVGLDVDLIEWLRGEGMDEEADMVAKARQG